MTRSSPSRSISYVRDLLKDLWTQSRTNRLEGNPPKSSKYRDTKKRRSLPKIPPQKHYQSTPNLLPDGSTLKAIPISNKHPPSNPPPPRLSVAQTHAPQTSSPLAGSPLTSHPPDSTFSAQPAEPTEPSVTSDTAHTASRTFSPLADHSHSQPEFSTDWPLRYGSPASDVPSSHSVQHLFQDENGEYYSLPVGAPAVKPLQVANADIKIRSSSDSTTSSPRPVLVAELPAATIPIAIAGTEDAGQIPTPADLPSASIHKQSETASDSGLEPFSNLEPPITLPYPGGPYLTPTHPLPAPIPDTPYSSSIDEDDQDYDNETSSSS